MLRTTWDLKERNTYQHMIEKYWDEKCFLFIMPSVQIVIPSKQEKVVSLLATMYWDVHFMAHHRFINSDNLPVTKRCLFLCNGIVYWHNFVLRWCIIACSMVIAALFDMQVTSRKPTNTRHNISHEMHHNHVSFVAIYISRKYCPIFHADFFSVLLC